MAKWLKTSTTQIKEAKELITFPFRFLVPILEIRLLSLENTENKLDLHFFHASCATQ